jgi:hypothetical protein
MLPPALAQRKGDAMSGLKTCPSLHAATVRKQQNQHRAVCSGYLALSTDPQSHAYLSPIFAFQQNVSWEETWTEQWVQVS